MQKVKDVFISFGIGLGILGAIVLLGFAMKLIPVITVTIAFILLCYYVGELVKTVRRVKAQ